MFERFTSSARAAVEGAQEEARSLRHGAIGCEHLLIALADGDEAAAGALRRVGASADALRTAVGDITAPTGPDADALATIGIDLEEVRRRVERAFGPGALERRRRVKDDRVPFSPTTKKALELALRYAIERGDQHIGSEHVLLGVLRAIPEGSPAACALARLGVAPRAVRGLLEGERSL